MIDLRRAALLVSLASVSCSSGTSNPDAGAGSTGSTGTSGATCHAAAETSCTSQADCGGTRAYNLLLDACIPDGGAGVCVSQAPVSAAPACVPIEPNVTVQVNVNRSITQPLGSLFLRAYYPVNSDGTSPDCTLIMAEADTATDGGQQSEDADPRLNLAFWGGFRVGQGSGQYVFDFSTPLVAGPDQTLYVEGYSSGLDSTTGLPLGIRLGRGCLDAQSILPQTSTLQTFLVDVQ